MTQLLPNIFAQPLHPSEYRGEIIDDKLYLYHKAQLSDDVRSIVDLPPGSYEILFTTKGVSEEQAASIVERDRGGFAGNVEGYKEYFKPGDWSMDHEPFKSAIKSLQSLLKSKGLTAGNYLIIKKVEG